MLLRPGATLTVVNSRRDREQADTALHGCDNMPQTGITALTPGCGSKAVIPNSKLSSLGAAARTVVVVTGKVMGLVHAQQGCKAVSSTVVKHGSAAQSSAGLLLVPRTACRLQEHALPKGQHAGYL
jgi:hypothetical protein